MPTPRHPTRPTKPTLLTEEPYLQCVRAYNRIMDKSSKRSSSYYKRAIIGLES
ncbi:hypothetical protein PVAG01_08812 [Phlyctema vagabunda]|uniref:Uncharacterized protein n=1 Tax=Phlyctema vagabunda TaxID=108571 RepID=A0ABR4PAI2_9HELO